AWVGSGDRGEYIAQGEVLLTSDAGAVFVFGRKDWRLAVTPGELALDWSPLGGHGMGPAVQLGAFPLAATDAERSRLAEENVLQRRYGRFRRDDAKQHAGTVLLHENRDAVNVQRAGGEEALVAVTDDLGGEIVEVGF